MPLFWEFFSFELKFRLKSASTYVYFALWFFLAFLAIAAEDFLSTGNDKILLNGPFSTSILYIITTFFGAIVIAAIFGTSILRDFQRDTYQLLFTKPITKFAYLGGRWAGSFVTSIFCFSGMVFGEAAGTLAPWADHTRIVHGHFGWYLHAFLAITVVQIFFLGSLFFTIAALTRKLFIVYLQGVVFFVVYLIVNVIFQATGSLEHFWSAIFDPVGLRLFDSVTRYWTVFEKNTLQLSWSPQVQSGIFLYNRLLWSGVGLLSLALVYKLFPLSVEALTAVSQGRRAARARENDAEEISVTRRSLVAKRLPTIHQVFAPGTSFAQLVSLTRIRISNITHELPFWALFAVMLMYALLQGHFAGHSQDGQLYPVTYLMVAAVEGNATLLLFIIATLYAGELVWRERDTHFDGIHDALPSSETTDWLSKLAALAAIELILLTVVLFCGVLSQTIAGYYHYELLQYFKELYLVTFPQILIFTLAALFFQTILSNKFIAHGVVIGLFVLNIVLFNFGWENTLYLFGNTPPYTYSDMNGYGHFLPALFWSITYWLSIGALMGVLSIAVALRGSEDSWAARLRLARHRAPRLIPAGVLFLLIAIGSGGWYFYNAHVLNQFLNAHARRDIQAQYERDFKKYEKLPQPKIISVDANIDIFPERRAFSGTGHFVLQNKTSVPIPQIHISNSEQSVTNVEFDRPFHIVSQSPRAMYAIYALDQPLAPGDKLNMTFNVGYAARGFRDGNERPEFAHSGTFFDVGFFPYIGYNPNSELDDPRRRRDEHLPPLEELAHRGDPYWSRVNLFSPDSDWITYKTTVSTSADQIALAPGYPTRTWQQNGRNYFLYDMGQVHMQNFYAYVSGIYNVKREVYNGVAGPINLEVYSAPAHPYDVQDTLDASKAGLAYYEKNYSPFQFNQFRILEYPRYRNFAQSFPNTVPYTEPGFLGRVVDPEKDIDRTYFVTAHELAHQWWGHQLIGGMVEGSNMMSESLAEYSALRVAQKKYGDNQMHKFLKHELDGYLRGRAGESRHEPPLVLVQREAYVWYQKGSLVLYGLSDYIGEDKLNLALHNFLMQYRYANATDNQDEPYPDTRQFVAALRSQTPPEFQYYISDAFENIVLYDNKTLTATYVQTPDKKYKVTLTVQAKKYQSDGSGRETPMPLNDFIDIGIFTGKKDQETPLYLQKAHIVSPTSSDGKQTFEIIVNQLPTRAGIDPINKLIDRIPDDNTIDVTKP
jgi:ABC-2 type transport system permease protein